MSEPQGWTVFRVPRSHWHCFLWDFDWKRVAHASLESHVTKFLHGVQDGKSPHLILMGPPGIGKTHLGIGIYRVATAVWGTELCTWLNVPDFVEQVKRSYDGEGVDPWIEIESAKRLVVLDDMFARMNRSDHDGKVYYRLIDTAYQNKAAIVATTNLPFDELKRVLPPHEISRLLEDSTRLVLDAPDSRIT